MVYFDHSANKFIAIAHDEASDQFYDVNSGSNVFAAATGNITCSTDTGSAATTTTQNYICCCWWSYRKFRWRTRS